MNESEENKTFDAVKVFGDVKNDLGESISISKFVNNVLKAKIREIQREYNNNKKINEKIKIVSKEINEKTSEHVRENAASIKNFYEFNELLEITGNLSAQGNDEGRDYDCIIAFFGFVNRYGKNLQSKSKQLFPTEQLEKSNIPSWVKKVFSYAGVILTAIIPVIGSYLFLLDSRIYAFNKDIRELQRDFLKKEELSSFLKNETSEIFSDNKKIPPEIKNWISDFMVQTVNKQNDANKNTITALNESIHFLQSDFQHFLQFEALKTMPAHYVIGKRLKLFSFIGKAGFRDFDNFNFSSYESDTGNDLIPIYLNLPKIGPKLIDQKYLKKQIEGRIIFVLSRSAKATYKKAVVKEVLFDDSGSDFIATLSLGSCERLAGRKLNPSIGSHSIEINFLCNDKTYNLLSSYQQ